MQIVRNYVNAAKAVGGTTVYQFEDGGIQYVTLKIVKNNAEVWAKVEGAGNGMYKVHIIERQLMKQEVRQMPKAWRAASGRPARLLSMASISTPQGRDQAGVGAGPG